MTETVHKCPICLHPFVTEDQLLCHHMLQQCPLCDEPGIFYALKCGHCICIHCIKEFKNEDNSSSSSYSPSVTSPPLNPNHSPLSTHQTRYNKWGSEHGTVDLQSSPSDKDTIIIQSSSSDKDKSVDNNSSIPIPSFYQSLSSDQSSSSVKYTSVKTSSIPILSFAMHPLQKKQRVI